MQSAVMEYFARSIDFTGIAMALKGIADAGPLRRPWPFSGRVQWIAAHVLSVRARADGRVLLRRHALCWLLGSSGSLYKSYWWRPCSARLNYFRNLLVVLSASTLPPVWHVGQ